MTDTDQRTEEVPCRGHPSDRAGGSTCCHSWSPTCGSTARRLREEWAERIQQAHLLPR